MKDYFEKVFNKATQRGYIQFNNITGRKYFYNIQENNYFKLRDEVEDKYFRYTSKNPGETLRSYNAAKSKIANKAQNYPIQGTASDISKFAGVLFMREILSREWFMIVKIVNMVHDEYLVECPIELVEEVKEILANCMIEAGKPFCKLFPLTAEAIHGEYWVH